MATELTQATKGIDIGREACLALRSLDVAVTSHKSMEAQGRAPYLADAPVQHDLVCLQHSKDRSSSGKSCSEAPGHGPNAVG